jgi:hypothetical protein
VPGAVREAQAARRVAVATPETPSNQ